MQHVLQFWYCNQPSPLSDVASALFDHSNNFPIYMGSCNHNVHIHFLFSLSCLAISSETSHLSLPQFQNYFKKLTKTATKLFSATWRFALPVVSLDPSVLQALSQAPAMAPQLSPHPCLQAWLISGSFELTAATNY